MQEKEVNVLKVGISSTRFSNESYEIKDFGSGQISRKVLKSSKYQFMYFCF